MLLTDEIVAEIKFLSLFNLETVQEGVKVHGNADPGDPLVLVLGNEGRKRPSQRLAKGR